ncbi:leucine-rich repeat domain-containing protein [Estrella lausannensis]|uniref:Leucine rich repeat protein n=1 Tax=Estrella lausannensis TaxID=483423 RepID=A0A0H5DNM6_9BACT|nr:leucine-rich repeat domain-containing protein [Estrella lausannensis]CRX37388.1 Leucine rich repeat protein [Estrella lausannensis]
MDSRSVIPALDTNTPYYVPEGECPIAKLPVELLCKIFTLTEGSLPIPLVSTGWNKISRTTTISYPCLEKRLPSLSSFLIQTDVRGAYDEITARIHRIWAHRQLPEAMTSVQPTFACIEEYAKRFEEYKNLMTLALVVRRHIRQTTTLEEKLKLETDPVLRLPHIKKWFEENQEELAHLKDLSIELGDITEIPEELNYFTGLEKISFRGNQIRSIPGHFGRNLPLLSAVDLRQNQVSTISADFCINSTNIHTLQLDNNKISQLPENFGLGMIKLSNLDLGSNKLKKVPSDFGRLFPNMYRLCLSNNEIEELNDEFGSHWTKLRFCELKDNKLSSLPSSLAINSTRVMLLSADWEKIKVCPKHLVRFSSLRKSH